MTHTLILQMVLQSCQYRQLINLLLLLLLFAAQNPLFLLRRIQEVLRSKWAVFSDGKELFAWVLILYKYLEVLFAVLRPCLAETGQVQFGFSV